jgi:hypothetical protein
MQTRTRERPFVPPLPLAALVPLAVVAVALVALAQLRWSATPADQARATLAAQLHAYASWEREHPHECLVPLPDPRAVGNQNYERRAAWFLADRGATALLDYRAWFRATYAAEHPGGARRDRYLIECTPAAVLGAPPWLDRYLAATAAGR